MSTAKLKTSLYLPAFSSIALYAQIFTSLKKTPSDCIKTKTAKAQYQK